MSDMINHPKHYAETGIKCLRCAYPIECISLTRQLPFSLGNAIKYLWRAPFKGSYCQDIKKAIWYMQDEIETTRVYLSLEPNLFCKNCDKNSGIIDLIAVIKPHSLHEGLISLLKFADTLNRDFLYQARDTALEYLKGL